MIVFIRTVLLFILVMISMRLMGKRQIGELQPYEFTAALLVSEIAAIPMQDSSIPLVNGIIPVLVIISLQILISFLDLKFMKFRNAVSSKATILVEHGIINIENFKKELFTLEDMTEQLRINGTPSIKDVLWMILESGGDISIVENTDKSESYEKLPLPVIMDGHVISENLTYRKKSAERLEQILKSKNLKRKRDVFYASLESDDTLYIQTYDNKIIECKYDEQKKNK